ncbi:MAG: hypothetical protein EA394_00545 [Bacteroidia bacterium]|nr:MAG: hypothetical protein EA394_00545 [Bacteroidia bacterium]
MSEYIAALQKYTFWDAVFPDLGVTRRAYLSKLWQYTGNRLVKVLVGQRRAGKSFLLRQTIRELTSSGIPASNIFYLNKEYTDFDFVADYKQQDALIKKYLDRMKPKGKVYLFVDEIQEIEGWEGHKVLFREEICANLC